MQLNRCSWCGDNPIYIDYHDNEWGKPIYDDNKLFEFLILEGAQAGLSWNTILKKRAAYRKLFAEFDPAIVAKFTDKKLNTLLQNEGIVRNRLKVYAARKNAQAYLQVQKEFGNFSDFLWAYVDGKPIKSNWQTLKQVPTTTPLAEQLSHDLKKRGFSFVGPTICYAFMQAVGIVNDHLIDCFCYR